MSSAPVFEVAAEGSATNGSCAPSRRWKDAPSVVSETAALGSAGAWLTDCAEPGRGAGAAATGVAGELEPPPASTA